MRLRDRGTCANRRTIKREDLERWQLNWWANLGASFLSPLANIRKGPPLQAGPVQYSWLRGMDLNHGPSGYEPG